MTNKKTLPTKQEVLAEALDYQFTLPNWVNELVLKAMQKYTALQTKQLRQEIKRLKEHVCDLGDPL